MADEVKVKFTASAEEVGEAAQRAAAAITEAARIITGQITPAQVAVGALGEAITLAGARAQAQQSAIATTFAAIAQAASATQLATTASAEAVAAGVGRMGAAIADAARIATGVVQPVQAAVGALAAAISQAAAITEARRGVGNVWQGLADGARTAQGAVANLVAGIAEAGRAADAVAAREIGNLWQGLADGSAAAAPLIATLDAIAAAAGETQASVERMAAGISLAARAATESLTAADAVANLGEAVAQAGTAAGGGLAVWVRESDTLATASVRAAQGVVNLAQGIAEAGRAAQTAQGVANLAAGITEAAQAADGLGRIRTLFEGIGGAVGRAASSIGSAVRFIGGSIVVLNQGLDLLRRIGNGVQAAWEATVGAIVSRGSELDDQARRFGSTAEAISRLDFIARQAGLGGGTEMFLAYRTLARQLVETGNKGSDAERILVRGLGMTRAEIERLKAASPEEAILAIGRALDAYPDSAEKAAAAQALFGRGAEAVFQLLRQGDEAIRQSAALAEELGVVMDGETAAAANRLGDALDTTDDAWMGFLTHALGGPTFLGQLAESVEDGVKQFAAMGRELPEEKVRQFQTAVQGLVTSTAQFATDSGPKFVGVLAQIVEKLQWIIDNAGGVSGALGGGILGALAGFFSPVPGGTILGAVGGAGLGFRVGQSAIPTQQEELQNLRRVEAAILSSVAGAQGGGEAALPRGVKARLDLVRAQIRETEATIAGVTGGMTPDQSFTSASAGDLAAARGYVPPKKTGPLTIPGKDDTSEAFRAFQREQEDALRAERENAERRLAIIREFTVKAKALFGEKSEEYQRQLDVEKDAEQAAADQKRDIARAGIQATRDAALAELEAKKAAAETDARLGLVSQAGLRDALRAYYDERYRIIETALKAERELTSDPVKQKALTGEIGAAGTERDRGIAGVNADEAVAAVERVGSAAEAVVGTVTGASNRMVQGLIQGTQTFRQMWANTWQSIGAEAANAGIRMVGRWVIDIAKMVAATVVGEAAKTAATETGEATRSNVQRTYRLKEVFMNAKTAASGAYSALASVPYVGPVLGAAAAALVFAGVMALGSFRQGGNVPDDMIAQVHKNEMVLPVELADVIRGMAASGGATRAGFVTGMPFAAPGTVQTPEGAKPYLSAAGGLERVPDTGAVVQAHPRETVLPADVADDVREGAKGEGRGREGGRGEAERAGIVGAPSAAAVVANVPLASGGGTGSNKAQPVTITGSSATIDTKSKGGTIETTASGPVQTMPVGGVTPVAETQERVQPVTIQNAPVRVAFNAISTMVTISAAPFGIGTTIGVGFISAFAKGGNVPEDMLAKLHGGEMVLPQAEANVVRNLALKGAPSMSLPADVVASVSSARALGSRVGGALEGRRDEDRRALIEGLAELPREIIHNEPHLHMIDTETGEQWLRRQGKTIEDIAAAPFNRSNRGGPRGRR